MHSLLELGGVLLVDLDVVVLGILGGKASLALPGEVTSLLLLILWLLNVAVTNGGLLVVAVELQDILLSDVLAESLGLLNDFLKLPKESKKISQKCRYKILQLYLQSESCLVVLWWFVVVG